jgi:hypothetical protein
MAIKFQDFNAGSSDSESSVLKRLNTWVSAEQIEVINIESVNQLHNKNWSDLPPMAHEVKIEGSYLHSKTFFRVWYNELIN